MPQRTLRFKIRQDGRVEETVEGLVGEACIDLTEKLEDALGTVERREATSDTFLREKHSKTDYSCRNPLMSHFSTVKTQLRKKEFLKQALIDLGYCPNEGENLVRGYRGQTVKAQMTVEMSKGADIGFRWNENSKSYELVTDLDLWKQSIPIERFLAQVTQRYALNTVLDSTAQEGFQISEQKENLDGSIELVVTRWDS